MMKVMLWRRRKRKPQTHVVFIHIQKTAGYAIGRALRNSGHLKHGYGFSHDFGKKIALQDRKNIIMAVVRNPYDRVYSIFSYFHQPKEPQLTFEDFVMRYEKDYLPTHNRYHPCFDFMEEDGKILTTDILRFERLQEDFRAFCMKYGIPNNLTKMNVNRKKEHPQKTTLFTPTMREVVERVFAKDFEHFGYSFQQWMQSPW